MCQTLALPRRRRVARKTTHSAPAERMLRDIAYVLRISGRLAAEIRRDRSLETRGAAVCSLES
jgi:hypothetical protein